MVQQAARSGCLFCKSVDDVLGKHADLGEHKSPQVIIRPTNGTINTMVFASTQQPFKSWSLGSLVTVLALQGIT